MARTGSAWRSGPDKSAAGKAVECMLWTAYVEVVQDFPGHLRAGRRDDPRGAGAGGERLRGLLLHRSATPAWGRSWKRSPTGRRSSRTSTIVKEVWGAGQQQVRNIWTNVARLSYQPVDAYARGVVGLGTSAPAIVRSQRLAVGRSRTPPFTRQSPQSLAATHPSRTFIRLQRRRPPAAKITRTPRTTPQSRRLTTNGSQKVQSLRGEGRNGSFMTQTFGSRLRRPDPVAIHSHS